MPFAVVEPVSNTELQEIAVSIAKSKKVVVITGAGISTNCGIPDFRSEDGLYALIQSQSEAAAALTSSQATNTSNDDERPSKRRKLDRSASDGSKLNKDKKPEPALKRRLRSSQSLIEENKSDENTTVEVSKADEEPSPTTVPCSQDEPSSQKSTAASRRSLNFKGKDYFDADMIWPDPERTSTFLKFITSFRMKVVNDVKETSETHKLIKTLRDGGRLVRNYTQNIDMLEAREGLCTDPTRGTGSRGRFNPKHRNAPRAGNDHEGGTHDSGCEVVLLHGSLESLRCFKCHKTTSWDEGDRLLTTLAGTVPSCPHCYSSSAAREAKGRRSLEVGQLRPDIVLYGEAHPMEGHIGELTEHDIALGPDMLLIMGTSLKVDGLKRLVKEFAKAVHLRGGKVVFVNNTKPSESVWGELFDYWVSFDCDEWVKDLKNRREDIWTLQGSSREASPKPDKVAKPSSAQKTPRTDVKRPAAWRQDHNCGANISAKLIIQMATLSTLMQKVEQLQTDINNASSAPQMAPDQDTIEDTPDRQLRLENEANSQRNSRISTPISQAHPEVERLVPISEVLTPSVRRDMRLLGISKLPMRVGGLFSLPPTRPVTPLARRIMTPPAPVSAPQHSRSLLEELSSYATPEVLTHRPAILPPASFYTPSQPQQQPMFPPLAPSPATPATPADSATLPPPKPVSNPRKRKAPHTPAPPHIPPISAPQTAPQTANPPPLPTNLPPPVAPKRIERPTSMRTDTDNYAYIGQRIYQGLLYLHGGWEATTDIKRKNEPFRILPKRWGTKRCWLAEGNVPKMEPLEPEGMLQLMDRDSNLPTPSPPGVETMVETQKPAAAKKPAKPRAPRKKKPSASGSALPPSVPVPAPTQLPTPLNSDATRASSHSSDVDLPPFLPTSQQSQPRAAIFNEAAAYGSSQPFPEASMQEVLMQERPQQPTQPPTPQTARIKRISGLANILSSPPTPSHISPAPREMGMERGREIRGFQEEVRREFNPTTREDFEHGYRCGGCGSREGNHIHTFSSGAETGIREVRREG